ncbi:MAG: hypothetical protein ACPGJS_23750 [Flammeovirgaceae bacterium]
MERFDLNKPIAPRFTGLSTHVEKSDLIKETEGDLFLEDFKERSLMQVSDHYFVPPEPSAMPGVACSDWAIQPHAPHS